MDNLIKRSDAIEVVNEAFDIGDCCCDRYGIIGAIQSISTVDRPRGWIPCSERLPSKGIAVLVNGIMPDAPSITISTDAPYYYEQGWINAWMPLPEPWEGEDYEV